ncbi:MAG: PIG-L deacetylase family protein [Phenylobacterium sp.]|uniref:PIG-L deacetylase family protein n=1 Tax=Phenylobacterium sp. TaxID=1871053 RepID=UPI00391DEF79
MIWAPLLLAGAAGLGGFLYLRGKLNDEDVPVVANLFPPGAPRRVLAVWAHPDDEITCAGTLAAMARAGAEVHLLYLTAGEAARDTGYSPEELAEVRRGEAQAAGEVLGVRSVEVLAFPDGGLSALDPVAPKAAIARKIAEVSPDLVIGFDEKVGFYGHPDHVKAGRWLREVVEENPGSVRRLWQATLPRALIALALKLVQAFRDHYPTEPERGLPAPDVAVRISSQATAKRRLLDAHTSQAKIIADVQPYYDRVPAWLYYRLFDREYFHLALER